MLSHKLLFDHLVEKHLKSIKTKRTTKNYLYIIGI